MSIIVKIQMPQAGVLQALIYDQHRTFKLLWPVTPELTKLMHGRPKAFYYAEVVGTGKERTLDIGDEAEWQEW